MSFMVNSRFYIRGFSDSRCPIKISLSAPKHSETCHVSLSTPNNVLLLSNKDIPKTAWKIFGRRVLMHNFSYDNEFDLHATEILNEWFPSRCKTRFETEAKYKCELALYTSQKGRKISVQLAK